MYPLGIKTDHLKTQTKRQAILNSGILNHDSVTSRSGILRLKLAVVQDLECLHFTYLTIKDMIWEKQEQQDTIQTVKEQDVCQIRAGEQP